MVCDPLDFGNDVGYVGTRDRRAYHRAYYWAHVERRREQARRAHSRRLRALFGDQIPSYLTRLLRRIQFYYGFEKQ